VFNRYELKYYLNEVQTAELAQRLCHVLKPDSNGDSNGEYKVNSLYFDSIDDECLYQKQSGILTRKKLRMRTYGSECGENVNFEIKHKHGQRIYKEMVLLPRNSAELVCQGEYSHLLELNHPVLDQIYGWFLARTYQPKVIVGYTREAYVFPELDIRITLDKNLRSDINHVDFFSSIPGNMPVILEGKQILEIKYNQYFPDYLKNLLSSVCAERMAISKYTLARRFHKLNKWEDN